MLGSIYPLSGCAEVPDKQALRPCLDFITQISAHEGKETVEFNLEKSLGITEPSILTAAYDAIQSIDSNCSPGDIAPSAPEEIMSPWDTRNYIDISAGVSGTVPWIQFVYPSIGDYGPGLASSVVFYDDAGHPIATNLVSEYHSWENASILYSVMSSGKIESCRQNIEYFSYSQDGDILGELESPLRSECEYSRSTYPYPAARPL